MSLALYIALLMNVLMLGVALIVSDFKAASLFGALSLVCFFVILGLTRRGSNAM